MSRTKESGSEKNIIDVVSKQTNFDRRLVKEVFFSVFETMQDQLVNEGSIRVPWGKFTIVKNKYHCDNKLLLGGQHRAVRLQFRVDQFFKSYIQSNASIAKTGK